MSCRKFTLIAAAAFAALGALSASAQAGQLFGAAGSHAEYVHYLNGDVNAGPQSGGLTLQNSSSPTNQYALTRNLPANGTTLGRAGVGYVGDGTRGAITWPSAMGVNQVDPDHNDPFSKLDLTLDMRWQVFGGSVGPTSYPFSIPVAGSVGPGGFAIVNVNMHWYWIRAGESAERPIKDFSSGNFFTTSFATAITAPSGATFPNVPLFYNTGDILGIRGSITFGANNDDGPTDVGLPDEFRAQFWQGVEYVSGFDITPEPGSAATLALGTLGALARRRRTPTA